MGKGLKPDWYFDHYYEVTPAMLQEAGINHLILDIDNTLAPYEQSVPDERILNWFHALKEADIACAFVSNNSYDRVELFNRTIGIPMFPKGGKPGKKSMLRAMEAIGAVPGNTAIMGDQIFTDVWAGRGVGIRTILVPPIKDKRDIFTKAKRLLEKPILKRYHQSKEKES